ncbi:hypothetical protein LTR94_023820 [Friedmanniomyces endolithicus]|nr:hypothetical protein LTR94_023820 [Friedmanniomyces endolithicus]
MADKANTAGLITEIDAEMDGRQRGYADVRGELLFRCRDALVTAASAEARIAGLEARIAELEAAKWEAKHADTMNDIVAMGVARDTAEARADRLARALVEARKVLDTACCWSTTEKWSASDFREHVRAGNLRLCALEIELPTQDAESSPCDLQSDSWLKLATDAAWARNMDGATAMMVDLDDLYALISASRAALQQEG